jgi:predicted RNA-binding protein YlqC (UPF0109 family)
VSTPKKSQLQLFERRKHKNLKLSYNNSNYRRMLAKQGRAARKKAEIV